MQRLTPQQMDVDVTHSTAVCEIKTVDVERNILVSNRLFILCRKPGQGNQDANQKKDRLTPLHRFPLFLATILIVLRVSSSAVAVRFGQVNIHQRLRDRKSLSNRKFQPSLCPQT
jgi:hypothetical protein